MAGLAPLQKPGEKVKGQIPYLPWQEDLLSRPKPSFRHRCSAAANRLVNSGKARFILVFTVFVGVGAAMIFFLEGRQEGSPFGNFFQALWFTVVTITTVGYGDISPVTPAAQAWAMMEMLVGVGLVGVITGSVASGLVESNRKRALGLVPIRNLSGHIVICGWKKDLRSILLGILEVNPWLSSSDLVLVTTHQPAEVGELKRERKLRGLHFVLGSHTDPTALEMAHVGKAERVIILADEEGGQGIDDADSRTVLAATTVETLNNVVYTCTEIIQPHFIRYLGPAGVEEVVLSEENARALLAAASLGNGIANVVTRFFPESGEQLRGFPVPPRLIGASYGEVARHFRSYGCLPIGLLENTGNLHARRRERIAEALREPEYATAVATLRAAGRVVSNLPRLVPHPETVVRENSKVLALLPWDGGQSEDEAGRRGGETPGAPGREAERLLLCGWKHDMADLLARILTIHEALGRRLEQMTVVARLPAHEAQAIASHPRLKKVTLVEGEPTDPETLRQAKVRRATRALVLTDPNTERFSREADARNVMIAFALNEANPSAYKCVEIINPNFGDHLRLADTEETIYTQQYQRTMLVQAALGTGLSGTIGSLFDPANPSLRVVGFPAAEPGTDFGYFEQAFAGQGDCLIGVVEYSGNHHIRRQQYLYEAQSQPNIAAAIDQLRRLKTIRSNEPVLNPGAGFLPGSHSRAVVITSGNGSAPDG